MTKPDYTNFVMSESITEIIKNRRDIETMPTTNFTVKYDGEALANHEMDVALLAPALMAMSNLVKEVSKIHSHGEYTATLNVKGNIKSGSIEIELVTQAVSLLQQFKDLLNNDIVTALLNFGGITGIIAGVYQLIVNYKGKSPDKVEKDGENVIMYFGDRKEITNTTVYQIYNNYNIRNDIYNTVKPLEDNGIDQFSIIQNNERLVTITDEELVYFEPNTVSTPLNENTQETILIIESLTFKEGNKWSFFDGNSTIKASILDEDFLAEIDKGKRFAKGDWLKVLLRKTQIEENGRLKTIYEVIKVIKHIIKEQYQIDL